MSRSVRCVAFDAVGTLIYPQPSVSRVYWEIGREFGSRRSQDDVRGAFQRAFQELSPGLQGDYSTSEVEERARWRRIVDEVLPDVTEPDACFERLYVHFGLPHSWQVFPDVAETLQLLHERGLSLILASNFDERLHPVCDALPQLNLLEQRVISASVGWHKPSPQFYAQLIAAAGCAADQILMVGDDHQNDVAAAEACGIQALLIDRQGAAAKGNGAISSLVDVLSYVTDQT